MNYIELEGIKFVDQAKYLGIMVDNKLNFQS